MHKLRDYQVDAVQKLRAAIKNGFRRILLVAPTGSGKTTIAAHIIQNAATMGNPVIFLAHRKELIDQCSARLDEHGVDHGVIKAGNNRVAPGLPVQVASVMTLVRRSKNRPPCKIFFIDEAHRAMAKSYLKVLESYPDVVVIGLTATPFRLDGRGLGRIFEKIEECSNPFELTERGFLVPARVFSAPILPSFGKIKKKMGDYDQKELDHAVNRNSIIGNIYGHWEKHAFNRLTVVFAVSCLHARRIMESFLSRGISADYIDGEMDERLREEKLAKFSAGETRVMCNVGVLTEGWDCPAVSCVILARPTQSVALYIQMAGRALRPHLASGKKDCIILDHGGNTMVHGFVIDDRVYDLDGIAMKDKATTEKKIKTCEDCFCVYTGAVCPECGHENKRKGQSDIREVNGELVEMDPGARRLEQRRYLHEMLRRQVKEKYKDTYAAVCFKNKYGSWPSKQLGVRPMFKYNFTTKKSTIVGFDYSQAMKEAHVGERSADGYLTKFGWAKRIKAVGA